MNRPCWLTRTLPALALAAVMHGQTVAPAHPEIETVTIHAAEPAEDGSGIGTEFRRASIVAMTVERMITYSYDLEDAQVLHLPGWARSDRFDVQIAAAGDANPDEAQWKELTRAMLAERFHLRVHDERRDLPIESLTVDRRGLQMKANRTGRGGFTDDRMNGKGNLSETNATMAAFSLRLAGLLRRPVIDNTGLGEQRFDFTLRWRDVLQAADNGTSDSDSLPDLRTALAEQLGLRVTSTHGTARVVVVDGLEHPTAN